MLVAWRLAESAAIVVSCHLTDGIVPSIVSTILLFQEYPYKNNSGRTIHDVTGSIKAGLDWFPVCLTSVVTNWNMLKAYRDQYS